MTVAAEMLDLPPGVVGVRVHLFERASDELRRALHPPWPRWMRRLYGLEQAADPDIDVAEGETTIPAAVSAMSNHLKHRLDIVAFVAQGLAELGWDLHLAEDDSIVATTRMAPHAARTLLELNGIAGPMCNVCDVDDSGWPRMWYGGEER
jgi:hypothetical protein